MRTIVTIILIVLLAFGCSSNNRKEQIGQLSLLHLDGSNYEQGFAHGRLLKEEIKEIITRWKSVVEMDYNQPFDSVIEMFFLSTNYRLAIKEYCPELLEEVQGLADGAEVDKVTMLAFQMSEEISVLQDELNASHCTSISINSSDTTSTLLAQNMDPPLFLHGTPILLHLINEDNTEAYVFTFPGFIGLCGLNNQSVGITCNGISMLNHSKSGLPVSFIVRSVLDQKSEEEAIKFLMRAPIAIPQCFTIGGIKGAHCVECSANEKAEFRPFPSHNISLHTNFAAANQDFNVRFIQLLGEYGKTTDDPYFCPRFFLAIDEIEAYHYFLDVNRINTILSLTKPEIEPISNQGTFGCLIMELSSKPQLYIAPGKPDTTRFLTFDFKEY